MNIKLSHLLYILIFVSCTTSSEINEVVFRCFEPLTLHGSVTFLSLSPAWHPLQEQFCVDLDFSGSTPQPMAFSNPSNLREGSLPCWNTPTTLGYVSDRLLISQLCNIVSNMWANSSQTEADLHVICMSSDTRFLGEQTVHLFSTQNSHKCPRICCPGRLIRTPWQATLLCTKEYTASFTQHWSKSINSGFLSLFFQSYQLSEIPHFLLTASNYELSDTNLGWGSWALRNKTFSFLELYSHLCCFQMSIQTCCTGFNLVLKYWPCC